jgi:hypothetical protein
VAGCVAGTTPTKSSSSPRKKSPICGLYIGGYGACIGNCSGARFHGGGMCVDICTPGNAGEPPSCQKQPGCEAIQDAQNAAAYAACTAQCDAMPVECR